LRIAESLPIFLGSSFSLLTKTKTFSVIEMRLKKKKRKLKLKNVALAID